MEIKKKQQISWAWVSQCQEWGFWSWSYDFCATKGEGMGTETQWHGITVDICAWCPHPKSGLLLLGGKTNSAGESMIVFAER